MTPALLSDYFPLQIEGDHRTSTSLQDREEKYITSGVTWQAYESLLSSLGNSSSYRVAYLLETLDECYCIGADKDIPDLAIEVVYTSGGVDTLEVYRRLCVREVWIWQNRELKVYCLQGDNYQQQQQSKLLPDLDLTLLAQYIVINDPLNAILQWRKAIA